MIEFAGNSIADVIALEWIRRRARSEKCHDNGHLVPSVMCGSGITGSMRAQAPPPEAK